MDWFEENYFTLLLVVYRAHLVSHLRCLWLAAGDGFSCHGSLPARPAQRNPWLGLSAVLCGSSSLRPNCQHKFIFFFIHLFICIYLLEVEGSPNSGDEKHLYSWELAPSRLTSESRLSSSILWCLSALEPITRRKGRDQTARCLLELLARMCFSLRITSKESESL